MCGFVVLGRQFIALWVGSGQDMAYYIALVVIVPALIPLSQNIGISVLRAMNKHKFRSIIYFFIALVNVVFSIPLAMKFGGIGSACATGFATCAGQIVTMNWFYYKKIGLDIPGYWRQIAPIALKITGIGVLGFLATYYIPGEGWGNLFVKGLVYCAIFAVLSWLFVLNGYEKSLVRDLFGRFRKK